MKWIANYTLHNQEEFVEVWEKKFGFRLNPTPQAPLIEFEKEEWTEERILRVVYEGIKKIKEEGYDGIMIGGLSNAMAYAWFFANELGMTVIMSKTPRKRTPDGKFIFELAGWTELFPPEFCRKYPFVKNQYPLTYQGGIK